MFDGEVCDVWFYEVLMNFLIFVGMLMFGFEGVNWVKGFGFFIGIVYGFFGLFLMFLSLNFVVMVGDFF